MELVDRLLEGEKGVELLVRHVEVEVCRLEEGKGTECLLDGGAEDVVGAQELVGQPVSHAPRLVGLHGGRGLDLHLVELRAAVDINIQI